MKKHISYKNVKALVTGGAGFIGSHIVEHLLSAGAHVTILDNFSTGYHENIPSHPHVTTINDDIRSPHACSRAMNNIDVIFHCAAFVSVVESTKNPQHCFEINITGTHNLLEAAVSHHAQSFVFSSSAAVYGNKSTPCRETDTLNPLSPYAESKIEGETLCTRYAQADKLRATILRYFNVHGPRQRADSDYAAVVAAFTKNLKRGNPLTFYGDGTQTRDFIHVHTVARANLYFGLHASTTPEIFNVASGTSINLFDLTKKLERELGRTHTDIIFDQPRQGDITASQADVSKLKSHIPEAVK